MQEIFGVPVKKGRTMVSFLSEQLRNDVLASVRNEIERTSVVNVRLVAERVRVRNTAVNIAREDIEEMVVNAALRQGCAIEFDGMMEKDAQSLGFTVLELELRKDRRCA
ncbi:MAG TPA: hypothetical protein VHC00_21630 [Rhizobiaceae bacterium]|nr:hypothetical protein [Rhizobiaceae bacterium]